MCESLACFAVVRFIANFKIGILAEYAFLLKLGLTGLKQIIFRIVDYG